MGAGGSLGVQEVPDGLLFGVVGAGGVAGGRADASVAFSD